METMTRKQLVHQKFITRWAKRYLEIQKEKGREAAIAEMNRVINPEDARDVGREARRLLELYPNLRPKN